MITTKSGSKLVFSLDDGSTVQYDLTDKEKAVLAKYKRYLAGLKNERTMTK